MTFKFEEQSIKGVFIITPQVFGDNRGYFMETYKKDQFEAAGIIGEFVQDNESSSSKGVLRGLHFQKEHTQGKMVRVTEGCVYDVAVDVRPESKTYGQYFGVELNSELKNMLYIPPGFAHGFLVMSEIAAFVYKCTDIYDPASEGGIPWNDEMIAIKWPELDVPYIISSKDEQHEPFKNQSFDWAKKYL